MVKAVLFAVLFAIVGAVVFALLAPLLFGGADLRRLGAVLGPVVFLVCGGAGFAIGWTRRTKP